MNQQKFKGWEYTKHYNYKNSNLEKDSINLYQDLLIKKAVYTPEKIKEILMDTRDLHKKLFNGLTPSNMKYFAGHYRGENFQYLKNYEVKVNRDECIKAKFVEDSMKKFNQYIYFGLYKLDNLPKNVSNSAKFQIIVTTFACDIFIKFLKIHPYANGNGHIARFILLAVLNLYGYEVLNFPIDPRPQTKDPKMHLNKYDLGIEDYFFGKKETLIKWIIELSRVSKINL